MREQFWSEKLMGAGHSVDLRETELEGEDWMHLAQEGDQRWDLVSLPVL